MKKLLIGILGFTLIFNTGCSLFKKENKIQSQTQTQKQVVQLPNKSTQELQWSDIYNYILDNGFALNDAIKISDTVLKWQERKDNSKTNITISLKTPEDEGTANINLTSSAISSVKDGILKSLANYDLKALINGKIQQQAIQVTGDINFDLLTYDIDSYIKINKLNIKQNVNPMYDMIIGTYLQGLTGKWIKLTDEKTSQNNLKLDYTKYVEFISNLLKDVKTYPIINSYKEETKDGTKIFYVKLDKDNIKKILKNVYDRLPNIFKLSPEEKQKFIKKLEEDYQKTAKKIDQWPEFTGQAIVKDITNFVVQFNEKQLNDSLVKLNIIGQGIENTYIDIEITTKEKDKLKIKSGKIKNTYTIIDGSLSSKDGSMVGKLTTNYNLQQDKFDFTLDGDIKINIVDVQNNKVYIEGNFHSSNSSQKAENVNIQLPTNYITLEQLMQQILGSNNMILPQQNQQFNVEELNK